MKRATRDYRHGPSKRKPYQRRSQATAQSASSETKLGVKKLMLFVLLLTSVLFLGFWVAQHFSTQGVKSSTENSAEKPLSSSVTQAPKPPLANQPQRAAQVAPIVVESLPMPTTEASESVQYTFYHGLAETEVVVDAEPIPVKLDVPYYIVAGAFSSESDALHEIERLQATESSVRLSLFKTGRYYRLRTEAFEDRLALNKMRNVLRSLGADTALMRAKK